MIRIEELNKKQLIAFVNSEAFKSLTNIPISPHRALSHVNNPEADDKDILLLLAYENKELAGYLGVLPDRIYFSDSHKEKCGWLSCLWVNPVHRGRRIAQSLLEQCFQSWENRILVTEFTPAAKKLYDKSGIFNSLTTLKGMRLYNRFDLARILPPKKNILKKSVFLLRAIDFTMNAILDFRFLVKKNSLHGLELEFTNHIDTECAEFISGKQGEQIFRRKSDGLNWLLKFPWVLSAPESDFISRKYHFSATDKSFNFYAIKVRNKKNDLIAFLIFSKRTGSLKLPYCYHKNAADEVLSVINYLMQKWRVKTMTVFHQDIISCIKTKGTNALFKKMILREYIVSNVFEDKLPLSFKLQDGDADTAFT